MKVRVLIIEDSEDDALLLVRELTRAGHEVTSRRVEDLESLESALAAGVWDVVLADYSLPHFSGIAALKVVRDSGLDLPFIMVSGTITQEAAVGAMKAGAHDYLMKDRLARLAPAVERELEEASVRRSKKQAEAAAAQALEVSRRQSASLTLLRELIEVSSHTLAEVTVEGVADRMVTAAIELTGVRLAAFGYHGHDGRFETIVERTGPDCTDGFDLSPQELYSLYEQAKGDAGRGPEGSLSFKDGIATLLCDRKGAANGILVVVGSTSTELLEQNKALLAQLAGLASLGLQHIEARGQAERRARQAEAAEKEKEELLERQTDLADELAAANEGLQEAQQHTARLLAEQSTLFRRLQETLLDIPKELPGVKFAHLYRSATQQAQVGGDFYDVFGAKGGRIAILIGDVSGHGLEAARIATLVKDVVHAFAHQFRRPHLVLRETNRLLVEKSAGGFVTAFLGFLDPESGKLTYSSAGHPPPLLSVTGQVESLQFVSLPMGVFADARYRDTEIEIEEGSLLLFYTDGITEARRDGDLYGEVRLAEALERTSSRPVDELPSLLLREALDFSGGTLRDDVALLAINYLGKMGAKRPRELD